MVFYAGKSAQLLGALPQTPVFGGRGRLCSLTPTRRLESSVPEPSWGLSPQTRPAFFVARGGNPKTNIQKRYSYHCAVVVVVVVVVVVL